MYMLVTWASSRETNLFFKTKYIFNNDFIIKPVAEHFL
jgi:hypothetical protein